MESQRTKSQFGNISMENKSWTSLVFDSTYNHAICVLDISGGIVRWNKTAESLTGYKFSEVIGQNYSILFQENEVRKKLLKKVLENSLQTGVSKFEKICVRKDKTFFWGSFVVNPVKSEQGKFHFFVMVVEDITSRKEGEQQKDEYIGIASHEMRTPVSALSLYSELLAGRLNLDSDKKTLKIFQDMKGQINRLVNLIDDLLVVNEIERNKLTLNKKPFLINKFIRGVIKSFQGSTALHKITFKGKVAGKVVGDEGRLTQVLSNLIANSIKYSPVGETVVIEARTDKNKVIISVCDSGPGISPNERNNIFRRYFRSYSLEQGNMPGLGLGLYISKEIVTKHNEKIWVKSKKGKGSTFYFSLSKAKN